METVALNPSVQSQIDYRRIEKALHFIEENATRQPALKEIASHVNLSEFHFERLFSRWAGTTPQRFLRYLTKEHALRLLHDSKDLLDITLTTGLSSPGRLHDLLVTYQAMTPGEIRQKGRGIRIDYGFHDSPFGKCLLSVTQRGICGLVFVDDNQEEAIQELKADWENAEVVENTSVTLPFIERIFPENPVLSSKPLPLLLKGTNFQIQVWEALLKIPAGQVTSYEGIARLIDSPKAMRAVGSAVGNNHLAYLIPCHRVIQKMGDFGNYHWGSTRKKAILGWEAARSEVA